MRVVFMGTPGFAVPILDSLIEHHEVVAVYTRLDAGSGRGRKILPSPVKERALAAGLPVEQPPSLRDPGVVDRLTAYRPDAIVVAAFGMILPGAVLAVPPLGCVNVHASILPRWRGAAPIQRAILAGDESTGVSIMKMEEGLDTGPTCLIAVTDVDEKESAALTAELAALGAGALLRALDTIAEGRAVWVAQDDAQATYADKLRAADVALDPSMPVAEASRRVRASGPSAPTRAVVGGKRLVITRASRSQAPLAPGAVSAANGLEIGFSDGALRLDTVVPEGRSSMGGDAFARGARLAPDAAWSRP